MRFARCVAKIHALDAPLGDSVVFNKELTSVRILEGQPPFALAALDTRTDAESAVDLRGMAFRTYETRKRTAPPGAFQARTHWPLPEEPSDEKEGDADAFKWANEAEEVFSTKPKRNKPGLRREFTSPLNADRRARFMGDRIPKFYHSTWQVVAPDAEI